MIQSIYDFLYNLVGHVWQYSGSPQYNSYQEQPYLYVASLIILILLFVVAVDLLYKFLASIFNFRM